MLTSGGCGASGGVSGDGDVDEGVCSVCFKVGGGVPGSDADFSVSFFNQT